MKPGMCLVLVLMAAMCFYSKTVFAQTECTNVLISMAPCLYYITGNSTSPSQQCCNQLAYVVRSSPVCLCQVLKGGSSQLVMSVNQTQALALPKACDIQTPPASRCNEEHGNGSKNVQRDGSSSDGSFIKFSFSLLSFLLAASYITIYSNY